VTTDDPKKAGGVRLALNSYAEADTSVGRLFVHDIGHDAVVSYAKQSPAAEPDAAVRALLIGTTSRSGRKTSGDVPVPLTQDDVNALSDADIEAMATAYLASPNGGYSLKKAAEAKPPVTRMAGESAVSFLDRLTRWRAGEDARQIKKFREEAITPSTLRDAAEAASAMRTFMTASDGARKLFEDAERSRRLVKEAFGSGAYDSLAELQKQARGLSDIVLEARRQRSVLDGLRNPMPDLQPPRVSIPELRAPGPLIGDQLRKATAELAEAAERREEQRQKEHTEQVEIYRSIHELTLKSSDLLAQLAKASGTMLEQFGAFLADFRHTAERADEGTRRSFKWAAWSLGITAALTILGFVVAVMAYRQDTANNTANDRWQAEVTEILKQQAKAAEKSRQDLAIENGRLRQRLDALEKASRQSQKKSPATTPGKQ
jgi:hypothetical protein